MVYLYRKRIGKKSYYYLRASVKKDGKPVTKDIAYLGNDPAAIMGKLDSLPQRHKKEIRRAYRTLNRFIQANHYLEKASKLKFKNDPFLARLPEIEACRLHWKAEIAKLDETTRQEVLKGFVIEFAFNTAAIEGNTITLGEARRLLAEERTPKDRSLREIYDLQNTERVFFELFEKRPKITHDLIRDVHQELLRNIDARKGYRTRDVAVFRARFKSTPARYVKTDMELLLGWLQKNRSLHPLMLATAFHHGLERIHPFLDGNGRTGRMLANLILLRAGYPPLIYRKKHRRTYLAALAKADEGDLATLNSTMHADLLAFSSQEYIENYWALFL